MYQSMTSNSTEVDDDSTVRTFGMLSTFPPTACGIATFAAALSAGLVANGAAVDVVRCGSDEVLEDPLVVAALGDGSVARRAVCVDALNSTDVAIIQHEYGIYDGPDGDVVLQVMADLVVPVVLIAHTVLSAPSDGQRFVLERACALADTVVVMTETARDRLLTDFDVDSGKVIVIPHGATTPPATDVAESMEVAQLAIECIQPTPACYTAVARSLNADRLLWAEMAPAEEKIRVTVVLFDAHANTAARRVGTFDGVQAARVGVADLVARAGEPEEKSP